MYEKFKSRKQDKPSQYDGWKRQQWMDQKAPSIQSGDKRCFNCGEKGHFSRFCPKVDKGTKCFMCHSFGHKASGCSKKKQPTLKKQFKMQVIVQKGRNIKLITVSVWIA